MKLVRCTIFVCFNYSTSLSDDYFSSFKNSNKKARLLRNEILSIRLRFASNRPYRALGTKLRVAKVKHNRLRIASSVACEAEI